MVVERVLPVVRATELGGMYYNPFRGADVRVRYGGKRESEIELAVAFFLVWSGLLEGTAGNLFV